MSSFHVRSFTEPGEFAAAIRGAKADLAVVGRGRFAAEIQEIEFGSLRIQRLSANLPLVAHLSNLGGRASFLFHSQPGPSLIRDGNEVNREEMVQVGRPQSHFQRSSGPIGWGTISLPLEDISPVEQAVGRIDMTPPRNDRVITLRSLALTNLQRLHAAVGSVAAGTPELIVNPEVARGMEQVLMQALVACLDSTDVRDQTPTQGRHRKIMQRFYRLLGDNVYRAVYTMEMATAVGASLRSLSICCQEHLGMSPKQYLLLRRMHLTRRALLIASPTSLTVTDVATKYGFWQFGRFAGHYKSLFGESPSVTLRRAAGCLSDTG